MASTTRAPDAAGRLSATTLLLLVSGMACYGSATPISRLVGRDFPVWVAATSRMLIAAAVLVPIAMATERRRAAHERTDLRRLDRGDLYRLAGMAVVGTFLFSVLMIVGMRRAPGAVGAVVMALTPAVTGLGAVAFLGDRMGRHQLTALVLGVVGVAFVNITADTARGTGDAVVLGSALVFGAVCCEAAYSLLGKRLTADLSPLLVTTVAAVAATVLFAVPAAVGSAGFDWSEPSGADWVALAWWGAGTMALGSWLWLTGMQRVSGDTAAPFMAVMPISALVLSYVLLDERFRWTQAVGMALVVTGLLVASRSEDGGDEH